MFQRFAVLVVLALSTLTLVATTGCSITPAAASADLSSMPDLSQPMAAPTVTPTAQHRNPGQGTPPNATPNALGNLRRAILRELIALRAAGVRGGIVASNDGTNIKLASGRVIAANASTIVVNLVKDPPTTGTVADAKPGTAVLAVGRAKGAPATAQVIIVLDKAALRRMQNSNAPSTAPVPTPAP